MNIKNLKIAKKQEALGTRLIVIQPICVVNFNHDWVIFDLYAAPKF